MKHGSIRVLFSSLRPKLDLLQKRPITKETYYMKHGSIRVLFSSLSPKLGRAAVWCRTTKTFFDIIFFLFLKKKNKYSIRVLFPSLTRGGVTYDWPGGTFQQFAEVSAFFSHI